MESTVPATDVHQGLAWAYVLNYLSVVLDGKYIYPENGFYYKYSDTLNSYHTCPKIKVKYFINSLCVRIFAG